MKRDCVFCKIIDGELPADFFHKGPSVVAFKDIHPGAPVHLLIVPRKHIRSVNEIGPEDGSLVLEMLDTARQMAMKTGIAGQGYKLLFNVERGGGQLIFHLHLHLMGGW